MKWIYKCPLTVSLGAVQHFAQASPMRCIGAGDALVLAQWTDENGPLDPWACALVPIGSDDGGDDDDDYNGAAATAGTAAAAAAAAPAERPTLAAAAACSPFARLLMDDAVGRGATLATLAATVETGDAVPLPTAAAAATRDAVPAKRRGGTKRKSARRLEKDAAWRAKAARELAMAKAQRALRAKTPCRYLAMPGGCRNGDACPFSHQQN